MVGWHKDIWDDAAWNNHSGDRGFRRNYRTPEFRRFYEEGVYNHFTITFGFILLLQLIFLFLFLLVKIIHSMAKKKTRPEYFNTLSVEEKHRVSRKYKRYRQLNDLFDQRILYTIFMMFIIEAFVFILYNFHHRTWSFGHGLFVWSIILAIFFFVAYVFMWI